MDIEYSFVEDVEYLAENDYKPTEIHSLCIEITTEGKYGDIESEIKIPREELKKWLGLN